MRSVLAFVVAVCIQLLPSNSTKLMWFTTKFHKKGHYKLQVY